MRYLDVQANGILAWLGSPLQSPAQRVYAALLRQRCSPALVPARLAEQLGVEGEALPRALFELNRAGSIQVCTEVRDYEHDFHCDHALLCEDLRDLGAHEMPQLLLACDDGLCLAQQGLTEEVCINQAAVCYRGPNRQFPHVQPIYLDSQPVRLCSIAPLRSASPALLRLARRLIGMSQQWASADTACSGRDHDKDQ